MGIYGTIMPAFAEQYQLLTYFSMSPAIDDGYGPITLASSFYGVLRLYSAPPTAEGAKITMGTKFRVWVASALGYVYEINDSLPTNDSVWVKVKAGVKPCAIAANSKNNKIYVANYGLPQQNYQSTVTIIHGVSDSAFTVNVGTNPASIAVNVRDSTVYVANRGSGDISVIK